MTLTLEASKAIQGVAGSATAVTYSIFGDEVSGSTNTFKLLTQGQLAASAGVLYTPTGVSAIVKSIVLANTTGGGVAVTIYVGGTAAANSIGSFTIPANGHASWTSGGWNMRDANGAAVAVGTVTLTGDVTGTGVGSVATTIAADAVDNTKLANMAQATFKMRAAAAGTGDPIDGTPAQAKTALAIANTDVSGLGTLSTQSGTFSGTSSGTNTGDVTLGAVGAVPNANGASLSSQALTLQPASASFPGVITAAQFVVLNNTSGTNSGNVSLGAVGASPNANGATLSGQALNLELASASFPGLVTAAQFTKLANTSGTNSGDQTIALTGDVTGSGTGSFAATIAANAVTTAKILDANVTLAKMANIATDSLIGRDTASSGVPEVIAVGGGIEFTGSGGIQTSAFTGDATKTAGGTATTLATVNSNVGTFGDATHIPTVTVDGKGRITAVSHSTFSAGGNAFGVVTGNTGTATSDATGDTIAITGTGSVSTAATDTPDGLVITNAAATTTVAGNLTSAEKITLNAINGQNSSLAVKRVFRPGDYMVGNTFDPTGASDSTSSFTAMMTAVNALGDRSVIELPPGVFKVDPNILCPTATAPITIVGAGRGITVLIPNSGSNHFIKLPSGADGIQVSDFAIYNTSGTPFTANSGILTNNADSITIERMLFVDLFIDVQVSGAPYAATLAGTTAITSVSPALVAGDVTRPVSGPGIVPGTTLSAQAGSSGTLSGAATTSGATTIFIGNTIKCSIQKTLHSQGNGNASSVGVLVNNGLAGDTYVGPDVVMSNTGNTRRKASVELVESGHYEVLQCNLTGSQNGITIDPGTGQIVAFGFHTNVLCDSNSVNGMRMDSVTASSTIKNIKSVNSWYSGTTVVNGSAAAAGVLTTGSGAINGVTFSNDRFLNNRTHGFEHGKGTDFRFVDCDMKGNSSVGSGTADGLNVAAAVSNWSINGGKFGGTDTVPTAGNQRYGIFVAAGAGDNIKVSPDDLTGNVTGPLSMGATGASVFINGCPGLAAPYVRTASSAAIQAFTTLGNMFIPKNSQRIGTTYRLTAYYTNTAAATMAFAVRYGATNDAVGSAATNTVVCTASSAATVANGWGKVEFMMTITALGASGNIQGSGVGHQSNTAASAVHASFGLAVAARASGAGFLAVATDADRYLTLSASSTISGLTVHNTTIEVVNY